MQGYTAPVYRATEQDRSGDFIMQGAQNFAAGISSGIGSLASGIADARKKSEETKAENDFLTEQWDAVKHQIDPSGRDPWVLEQDAKFHSGSLSARRGIVTGTMAGLDRTTKMLQQQFDNSMRRSADQRAWSAVNYSQNPANKLPQSYTTPGGGYAIVSANGSVQPESDFMPQTPDTGEWRDMPGTPGYLGHWTPKRGFTGATIPKPKDGTSLPKLQFVYDEQTKRGAYMNESGDIVDPQKLVQYEDVPGTGKPPVTGPMPMIPGVPPGMMFQVPGTGTPAEKRPVFPQKPENAPKAQVITGPQGTVRTKADGTEEFLTWGEDGVPRWQSMSGPSTGLLPPLPDQPPLSGQGILDILNK